jgi:hypothetical protein
MSPPIAIQYLPCENETGCRCNECHVTDLQRDGSSVRDFSVVMQGHEPEVGCRGLHPVHLNKADMREAGQS